MKKLLRSFTLSVLLSFTLVSCAAPPPTAVVEPVETPPPSSTPFIFPPTFTPTEPGPPTDTPTPRPTRTPPGTATIAPTVAPSATPLVNIRRASAADQPFITASLLFFEGGRIQLWDSVTGAVQPLGEGVLPEGLTHFSASDGGILIAVARQPDSSISEILVYNRLANGIVRTIPLASAAIASLAISPDGQWLAFISAEVQPTPIPAATATPLPTFTPTAVGSIHPTPLPSPTATLLPEPAPPSSGKVFVTRVSDLSAPRELGECAARCTGIFWSPVSDLFIWGDEEGLWGADPAPGGSTSPRLILAPSGVGASGGAQTLEGHLPLWSPSGRFLLVSRGSAQIAVVDLFTGLLEPVPEQAHVTGAAWLAGDLLFITQRGDADAGLSPSAELWGVAGGGGTLFALGGRYPLPGDASAIPAAPVQLLDGRIALTLINSQDASAAATSGVYLLNFGDGSIVKVNALPLMQVIGAVWLPDALAALIISDSRVLFVPSTGGQIYSVSSFLGETACCYLWMP